MSHIWLALVLIILSSPTPDLKADFHKSLYVLFVVLCKVMFSIQVNDLSDRGEDDAAGKKRWIFYLPKYMGISIPIVLITAGLAVTILASGSIKVILLYIAAILLGLAYSLRPVRFKEHGLWGLFVYSLAAAIIYVLVPWAWFEASLTLLLCLFIAVFSDKWVQIHFHQIVDCQSDLKNGTQTYAVRAGLERTRKSLRFVSLIASFSIIGLLVYVTLFAKQEIQLKTIILAVSTVVVASSGIYVKISKQKIENESYLVKELSWIYLGLTYLAFCVLPPVGFIFFALKEPLMWILVTLSTLSLLGISWHSFRYRYS